VELDRTLTPPKPGPRIKFVTPRNQHVQTYLCFSQRIWAHHVHWLGSRTAPCTLRVGNDGQVTRHCDHCSAQMPTRWKGYLHCRLFGNYEDLFLCLTPGSGWELENSLGKEYDLRGVSLDVHRAGKVATSPLIVRVNANNPRRSLETPELDPGPYLDTVFRKVQPLSLPR
jgi:hypothetical protein